MPQGNILHSRHSEVEKWIANHIKQHSPLSLVMTNFATTSGPNRCLLCITMTYLYMYVSMHALGHVWIKKVKEAREMENGYESVLTPGPQSDWWNCPAAEYYFK